MRQFQRKTYRHHRKDVQAHRDHQPKQPRRGPRAPAKAARPPAQKHRCAQALALPCFSGHVSEVSAQEAIFLTGNSCFLETDWNDLLKLNLWLKYKIDNGFYYNAILSYWLGEEEDIGLLRRRHLAARRSTFRPPACGNCAMILGEMIY